MHPQFQKVIIRALLLACALATAGVISSENAVAGMTAITITVVNSSVFDHTYDFKDGFSGREWQESLAASKSVAVSLTSNQSLNDGYGKLLWHQQGGSGWTTSSLLRHGEKVTL